jgi:hypothetical protein
MDNYPIQGCVGCSSTAGMLGCGTHGPNRIILSDPPVVRAAFVSNTTAAAMAERNRCRQIAADHALKCLGNGCKCAEQIASDIMNVAKA